MTTEKLMLQFDSDLDKLKTKADKATKSMSTFEKTSIQSTTTVEKSTKNLDATMGRFNLTLAAVGVSVGIVMQQMAQMADEYTLVERQIRRSEETQEGMNARLRELSDLSFSTGQSLKDSATLYARLRFATDELGTSQEDVLTLTDSLTKAFKSSGLTTQEAASATIQLSQAFAAGKLQGDEFRSVAENAPVIMKALAKEIGVTVGELKELGSQGKITAEVLQNAVLNSAKDVNSEFNRVTQGTKTLSEGFTNFMNGASQLVGAVDDYTGISGSIGNTVSFMGESLAAGARALREFDESWERVFGDGAPRSVEQVNEKINELKINLKEFSAVLGGELPFDALNQPTFTETQIPLDPLKTLELAKQNQDEAARELFLMGQALQNAYLDGLTPPSGDYGMPGIFGADIAGFTGEEKGAIPDTGADAATGANDAYEEQLRSRLQMGQDFANMEREEMFARFEENESAEREHQQRLLDDYASFYANKQKETERSEKTKERTVAGANRFISNSYASAFNSISGALSSLVGENEGAMKAIKIANGAMSAYMIYANSEAAAAAALAPPPLGLGPVAGAPLAATISTAGKVNAAAVMAAATANAFFGGGSSSSVGGASGGSTGTSTTNTPATSEAPETFSQELTFVDGSSRTERVINLQVDGKTLASVIDEEEEQRARDGRQ